MAEIRWKWTWRHFSAVGGPIWIKLCRLAQTGMLTAVIWSKSKPEVEFQYDEHFWRIHCHYPRATCHIAACYHRSNSMAWSQRHVTHCRVNEFHPPYWKLFFAVFSSCSLGFGERRLSYRLRYTCYAKWNAKSRPIQSILVSFRKIIFHFLCKSP